MKHLLIALALCLSMVSVSYADVCGKHTGGSSGDGPIGGGRRASAGDYHQYRQDKIATEENKVAKAQDGALKEQSEANKMAWQNCLTGIGGLMTPPDLGGLLDKVLANLQQKVCDFARQETGKVLNTALNKATFDLPGGLGTVGANSSIGGVGLTQAGATTWTNTRIDIRPGETVSAETILTGVNRVGGITRINGNILP